PGARSGATQESDAAGEGRRHAGAGEAAQRHPGAARGDRPQGPGRPGRNPLPHAGAARRGMRQAGAAVAIAAADGRLVRLAALEIDPGQLTAYLTLLREEIEASVAAEPGVVMLHAVRLREAPH